MRWGGFSRNFLIKCVFIAGVIELRFPRDFNEKISFCLCLLSLSPLPIPKKQVDDL